MLKYISKLTFFTLISLIAQVAPFTAIAVDMIANTSFAI
jgi:hypothetical protein